MLRRRRITSHSGDGALTRHLAATGGQQTIDQFESGRFAGAAAAQQHKSFTTADFQIQIVQQRVAVVETIGNVAEFDGRSV